MHKVRVSTNFLLAGDRVDLYAPDISDSPLPIVLFLQGFDVDKSYYSTFSQKIAAAGFCVIVPNHYPEKRNYFAPELGQILDICQELKSNFSIENLPFIHDIDRTKLILMGHSCGGITGIEAICEKSDRSQIGDRIYRRPRELVGGIFYGTNFLRTRRGSQAIVNSGIPVALIAGNLDGIVAAKFTRETYENLEHSPKAYISIEGMNHYGITDIDQPPGGPEEERLSVVDRAWGLDAIADWTSLFLKAYIFGDRTAVQKCRAGSKDDKIKVRVED